MSDKTAHIPGVPTSAFLCRIAQFLVAVAVVGLVANTINGCDSLIRYSGISQSITYSEYQAVSCPFTRGVLDPANFVIFCFVWTCVIVGYLTVTPLFFPAAYNMWAQLFFEITGCVFWFAGFASLAVKVRNYANYIKIVKLDVDVATRALEQCRKSPLKLDCVEERINKKLLDKGVMRWTTAAAGAGVGALVWILFMVTLIIFVTQLKRHLKDPANRGLSKLGFSAAQKAVSQEMTAVVVQQPAPIQPVQMYVQPTPAPAPPVSPMSSAHDDQYSQIVQAPA